MTRARWAGALVALAVAAGDAPLALPPTVSPGEEIVAAVLDPARTPGSGTWWIGGVSARGDRQVRLRLSPRLEPGQPLRVKYRGPRTSFEYVATDVRIVAPAPIPYLGPRIAACAPRVVRGGELCVCGYFPGEAVRGLRVNGGRADVAAASLRSVLLRTADLAPGTIEVTGDAAEGFAPEPPRQSELIDVAAAVDRNALLRGESTALRIEVRGATRPVEVRLFNRTPQIVRLHPAPFQVGFTSGGPDNTLERRIDGLRPGNFVIDYGVAGSECPCSDRRERNQVLALMDATNAAAIAAQLASVHSVAVVEIAPLPALGAALAVFDILDGQTPGAKAAQLAADNRVLLAQANQTFATVQGPPPRTVPGSSSARLLNAPAVDAARMASVRLAVVDSGVDMRHPALEGVVSFAGEYTGREFQADAHGTMLAGLLAARAVKSSVPEGLAPGVSMFALKACHPHSPGDIEALCSSAALVKAVQHAIGVPVQIVNLSVAGPEDRLLGRTIAAAQARAIAVVAAVGNFGPNAPRTYPAAFPGVIGVTAIDDRRALYPRANRGDYVALAAPGVDLLVPTPGGGQLVASGTSLAAAQISGLLALLVGGSGERDARRAASWLLSTPVDLGPRGRDPQFGLGLANGCAALERGGGKAACR